MKIVVVGTLCFLSALAGSMNAQSVQWTANGAPTQSVITGGGWTLEQSGAANGLKSNGYCDSNGIQVGNPGTERMQPYYFPVIQGRGNQLQGYFDWRPKDIDEAVAAAYSNDAGLTWTFQQKVLELRTTCPTIPASDPDGDADSGPPNNADNGDDDGQGHQYIIRIAGHTYLYTLIRAAGYIDQADLVIHDLQPQQGLPLNGAPTMTDAPTDQSPLGTAEPPFHTIGLLNPDGILGVVPGVKPLTIIYEQKILNGDNTGTTALPPTQQCITNWAPYYKSLKIGANDDITYLRLASTTDGVNFTDLGPLQGLNDPTTVSFLGTRWLATAGTIIQLPGRRYGLLYSGGNCVDADSDSFHYIGYAESSDLIHWNVVNGLNNPIVSIFPNTINVDANGIPTSTGGSPVTVPANVPVVGNTQGFFAGRVYAPSAAKFGEQDVTVIFAGYHTQKPKNGLGDYRSIGRVSLHSSLPLGKVGGFGGGDGDH